MEKIPQQNKIESKEKQPEIILHFFRHSEKESDKNKTDEEINLTEKGREMALNYRESNKNIHQSIAFGSPKKRTQETAIYQMLGGDNGIVETHSFEKLKEKVNKNLKVGSKFGVDKNLDFPDIEMSQFKQMVYGAFKKNEYISFLVNESDKLGVMFDSETETYSFKAAQVAKIIQKYVLIEDRWESLQKDKTKQYNPELERFLGTHQGIQECFLAKLIEITEGVDERERFIQSLYSGNGFDYNEGIEVKIHKNENGSKIVEIEYKGEKYQISKSLSPEIISKIADLV